MSWQSIQTALFYEVQTLVCPLFVHIQWWGIQSTNQPSGNSKDFAAKSLVDDNAHCSFGQQECYDLKCTSVPNWKGNMKQRKNEKIPLLVARRSTYSCMYTFHDEICANALGCVVGFNGSGEHEWVHRHRGFLCSWRRRLCTLCTIVCCCREWQCSHDKCSPQHLRHFRLGVPVSETCPEQERTALGRLSIMLFRGVCLNFMSSSVDFTADSWCPPPPFFSVPIYWLIGAIETNQRMSSFAPRSQSSESAFHEPRFAPLSQPGGKFPAKFLVRTDKRKPLPPGLKNKRSKSCGNTNPSEHSKTKNQCRTATNWNAIRYGILEVLKHSSINSHIGFTLLQVPHMLLNSWYR